MLGDNNLQTHETAKATKMTGALANIFMAKIKTKPFRQSNIKPREWRRYIDDVSPFGIMKNKAFVCLLNKPKTFQLKPQRTK